MMLQTKHRSYDRKPKMIEEQRSLYSGSEDRNRVQSSNNSFISEATLHLRIIMTLQEHLHSDPIAIESKIHTRDGTGRGGAN